MSDIFINVLDLQQCREFFSEMEHFYNVKLLPILIRTETWNDESYDYWFSKKFKEHFHGNYTFGRFLRYSTLTYQWIAQFPTEEEQTAFILRYS